MAKKSRTVIISAIAFSILLMLISFPAQAQNTAPNYEVDPSWPKPLPNRWVIGQVGGVCVDAQDHVFLLNRQDLTDQELDAGRLAPPVIEFDSQGILVNSWNDVKQLPRGLHGCTVD